MNSNNPQQNSPLVLVVDDDSKMRMQLRQVMEQAAYRVAEASDGEQALAIFSQLHPDIVVLDAVMPVMDGFSCCRTLQNLPGGDRTLVLMITALEDQESVDLAFEAGASDYIIKPIHWAVLRQRVRILLAASRTMAELRQQKTEAQTTSVAAINILESITDAFYTLDNEWKFTYLNQQAESLLQRTRAELLGKNLWDEFPQAISLAFYEQYHLAVSEQVAVKFEEFYQPLNAWFAVHAYPSKDGISVYFQDITERKRLEAIAHNRQQELFDFVENANVGMHWVGVEGQIVWANQAELDLLGYTQQEYIGQPITKFHADAEVIEDILQRLQANETLHDYEARLLCKDGSIKYVLIDSNVFWKDGQFIHTCCFTRDITQRKQIQEALRESEQRWQLALRGNNDGIWDWNVKTNEVFYSSRWKEMLGYEDYEISNHLDEWVTRVHPDDIGWVTQAVQDHFARKTQFYITEHRVRCKDQTYKWILDRGQALWDEDGKVVRMAGSFTDITDRKRTEEELRQSEEFLQRIIKSSPDCIKVLDLEGRLLYMSLGGQALLEIDNFSAVKNSQWVNSWQDIYHQAAHSAVETAKAGSVGKFQGYCPTAKGTPKWWEVVVTPLVDAQGKPEKLLSVSRDITIRKLAEEELQRQNQRSQLFAEILLKIRQSLQIDQILQTTVTEVQKLLQADRVLLFRLYHNGYGQIVNEAVVPGCLSVLGKGITDECFGSEYLKKYIQGRIYTISDIDKAGVQPCLAQFMKQFSVRAKLVMPILLKEELWGLLIAHQCTKPRQWSSFEIELLRQIADQIGIALAQAQMLEEETRQREELARSNAELQQFASVASHDLQEPLRKIQAFGNRLKASCGEALTPQGIDYLERMQNAAMRMQTLIEDLLTFSRITTKALPFVEVNLAQIAQEVLSDLELTIAQTEGRVDVGCLHTIEAEPVQMRQLLQNLIGNALKFHRDGETPVVKLDTQLLDRQQQPVESYAIAQFCQIIVQDNGIGFEEKYLDRIFNVFQRLHSRSEYEGTGMGLAIVRKIAERHGGNVTAKSTQGQGSTFIITLPIQQPRGENIE